MLDDQNSEAVSSFQWAMPLPSVNMGFGKGQPKEMETDLKKYEEGSESELLTSSEQETLWVTAIRADWANLIKSSAAKIEQLLFFFIISRKKWI